MFLALSHRTKADAVYAYTASPGARHIFIIHAMEIQTFRLYAQTSSSRLRQFVFPDSTSSNALMPLPSAGPSGQELFMQRIFYPRRKSDNLIEHRGPGDSSCQVGI